MIQQKLECVQKLLETYRDETMNYANLVKSFQKDCEKVIIFEKVQDKLEGQFEKQDKLFKQSLSLSDERLAVIERILHSHKDKIPKFEAVIGELREFDKAIMFQFDSILEKLRATDSKLEKLEKALNLLNDTIQKNKTSFESFKTDVSVNLDKIHRNLEDKAALFTEWKNTGEKQIEIIQEKQNLQDSFSKSVESMVAGHYQNFLNELKILSLRVKKIEEPVIVEDPVDTTKDDIEALKKQFSSIQLDLQNNNLKSANSATQFQIIEKKIENIYLLLKKIELGAKE